jgi:nitroreductase
MDALEALRTRRSIRKYKPDPVPKELVEQAVDCARLAPTANNVQPWEFVVVTDAARRKAIAGLTDWGKFIADAPVCVAVLCKDTKYYLEDGCAALENLMLAAHALGLGTCWIAGDKKDYADKVRGMLGAPAGYKLVGLVPLGYPAEQPKRQKRKLGEMLHWEKY